MVLQFLQIKCSYFNELQSQILIVDQIATIHLLLNFPSYFFLAHTFDQSSAYEDHYGHNKTESSELYSHGCVSKNNGNHFINKT